MLFKLTNFIKDYQDIFLANSTNADWSELPKPVLKHVKTNHSRSIVHLSVPPLEILKRCYRIR